MSDRSVARCQEGSPFVLCSTDTTLVPVNDKGGKSNAYWRYYSAKHKRHGCKVEIATAVREACPTSLCIGRGLSLELPAISPLPTHTSSPRSPATITRRLWQTGCTKELATSLPHVVMGTPGLMPRCTMVVSSTIISRQQRESEQLVPCV